MLALRQKVDHPVCRGAEATSDTPELPEKHMGKGHGKSPAPWVRLVLRACVKTNRIVGVGELGMSPSGPYVSLGAQD